MIRVYFREFVQVSAEGDGLATYSHTEVEAPAVEAKLKNGWHVVAVQVVEDVDGSEKERK